MKEPSRGRGKDISFQVSQQTIRKRVNQHKRDFLEKVAGSGELDENFFPLIEDLIDKHPANQSC